MLDRASNLTLGLVALNLTLGASEFLTSGGALGRLAHGLAYLITNGFVTLPLTLGMAVITVTAVSTRIRASASTKGALLLLYFMCLCEFFFSKEDASRNIEHDSNDEF
jgi:hypothetical protein